MLGSAVSLLSQEKQYCLPAGALSNWWLLPFKGGTGCPPNKEALIHMYRTGSFYQTWRNLKSVFFTLKIQPGAPSHAMWSILDTSQSLSFCGRAGHCHNAYGYDVTSLIIYTVQTHCKRSKDWLINIFLSSNPLPLNPDSNKISNNYVSQTMSSRRLGYDKIFDCGIMCIVSAG